MEIILNEVDFTYMKGTPFEVKALEKISIKIPSGSITGIVGNTGSGKSTLLQLIAGLIKADSGSISIGNLSWDNKKAEKQLRREIGIIFQNPEQQVFEETVEKEIFYGPRNFGYSKKEVLEYTKEVLENLKLPYEVYKDRSPFELSGGERKKIAIASILSYKPRVLLLDEPFDGLDTRGRMEIINMIEELYKKWGITIVIVSHNMDEIAQFTNNIVILSQQKIEFSGNPGEFFLNSKLIEENNLDIPEITKIINKLNKKLKPPIPLDCFTVDKLEDYIIERLKVKDEKNIK